MTSEYTILQNIEEMAGVIAPESIVSRTVYNGDTLKVILFGFAPGQELSEHTSAREVILHFLRGEATVSLGGETLTARPGTLIRMAPHLPHSVIAVTETVMLLHMVGK